MPSDLAHTVLSHMWDAVRILGINTLRRSSESVSGLLCKCSSALTLGKDRMLVGLVFYTISQQN